MKRVLLILALLAVSLGCHAEGLSNIIPRPSQVVELKGSFRLPGVTIKCDPGMDPVSLEAVSRFAARLSLATGKTCTVSSPHGIQSAISNGSAKGMFFIVDRTMDAEEYRIEIDSKVAVIQSGSKNGFLYALQTLKQMMPSDIFASGGAPKAKWTLPCCTIIDKPRFAYRGMHMDSSRHFWTVDQVKKYLDVMAMFKLNRLHWHLTDDQGWRVEIKAFPLLTQVGAYREGTMIGHDFSSNDGVRYGGSYTQEEIKEVIRYADKLGITIIPEIDLPGHMLAAMTAYPHLGCTGGPYATWTRWGVADQVLCVGKESTFAFLEQVLTEIAELFPSEYIHIGGDECPKDEWKKCPDCQALIASLGIKGDDRYSAEQYLQSYVTRRMQSFLEGKGKKIIGWDEILEGELGEGTTVMSWRGVAGAKEAASRGFDAIMTPNSHFYFDYCQSENRDEEPLGIGGFISLEKVYSFAPFEGLNEDQQRHILGVQANLWTEYISTMEHLEYMLLPRMLALSEVQWCEEQNRDYERFMSALRESACNILEKSGYNYRKNY